MIKEAIEKIQELATPVIHREEGRTFAVSATSVRELIPTRDEPQTITLSSLDSLVQMVKNEALCIYENPLFITVPTHETVTCFARPVPDLGWDRLTYYIAQATDVPGWNAKTVMPFEEALIALRTRFQATPDTDYALKLLSEITTGAKVTFNDNCIATSVVTKKGIDLQSNQAIRPIISLRPYRTFQEVEQPASQFLIRINERGISFIEADGGMWKLEARKTVAKFLEDQLRPEVESGEVVVAL